MFTRIQLPSRWRAPALLGVAFAAAPLDVGNAHAQSELPGFPASPQAPPAPAPSGPPMPATSPETPPAPALPDADAHAPGTANAAQARPPAEPATSLEAPPGRARYEERPPARAARAATPSSDPNPSPPQLRLARHLDSVLADAARDLALQVNQLLPARWRSARDDATALEAELLRAASDGWAIAPQLEQHADRVTLRLVAAPPGASLLRVSRTELDSHRLELQAISALKAITLQQTAQPEAAGGAAPATLPARAAGPVSEGRAVLAVSGALAGGYFGFSLEHIGGSGDPRLVYPLMALGAAVGVGASLVISEEWDIAPAEAWYTLAAVTWPTAAGMLIGQGAAQDPDSDRYVYGAVGTFAGLALGSVGLNAGEVEPAGALLTHSGGFFGALFGALGERLAEPTAADSPSMGLGVGMAAGSLLGGWGATLMKDVPSSRIVYVDLATILGMLAGAAAASPAIVGTEQDTSENRIWFAATAAGGIAGATLGVLLTRPRAGESATHTSPESHLRSLEARSAAARQPVVSLSLMPIDFADATPTSAGLGLRGRW